MSRSKRSGDRRLQLCPKHGAALFTPIRHAVVEWPTGSGKTCAALMWLQIDRPKNPPAVAQAKEISDEKA
jgi:hypothetical protein